MRVITLLPLFLLFTACQTTGPLDEDSPFHVLPSGSRLALKHELIIPAHSAGITLQSGQVVRDKDINQYHPHCRLEVRDVRETTQSVMADEFVVRSVHQETQTVARTGLLLAALRTASGPSFIVFRTILVLHSERQPRVRWLTCLQWGDPALGRHLSIREIRAALGGVLTLQLPSTTSDGNR